MMSITVALTEEGTELMELRSDEVHASGDVTERNAFDHLRPVKRVDSLPSVLRRNRKSVGTSRRLAGKRRLTLCSRLGRVSAVAAYSSVAEARGMGKRRRGNGTAPPLFPFFHSSRGANAVTLDFSSLRRLILFFSSSALMRCKRIHRDSQRHSHTRRRKP